MKSIYRFTALTFAALLTMALTLHYRAGAGSGSKTAVRFVVPRPLAAEDFKDETSGHKITRLAEHGEALGGGKRNRVEKSTATATAL